jgi:L-lactate dehydrogenase
MTTTTSSTTLRYRAETLREFAQSLFERAGARTDIAVDVATVLLDADLLGHTTHGLALLAPYLGELTNGRMAKSGAPDVLSRRAAAENWDGKRLPDRGLRCAHSSAPWQWPRRAAPAL